MEPTKKKQETFEEYDYLGNSASTQDCTGLIPSLPQNEAEWKSYENIYHFRPDAASHEQE